MPTTLCNLVIPEQGKFIGNTEDLSDEGYTMVWLHDGSVHILCDWWTTHRGRGEGWKLKVVDSYEPVNTLLVRDWMWQRCVGYSWLRDQHYLGSDLPLLMRLNHTWPPG